MRRSEGNQSRGGKWRAAAFFCAFASLMAALIVFFGYRETFPGFAVALSAVCLTTGAIAIARSDAGKRRIAVTWTVLGILPAAVAGILALI